MRILSFSIAHDSSVCSLVDGEIEFFAKEERLSRVKRDMHPFKALELYKNLNLGPIDHILYNIPSNDQNKYEFLYSNYIEKTLGRQLENYSELNHHNCHASLAFYNSGFEKALVVVIDRNGSIFFIDDNPVARESESIFVCSYPDSINPIYKSFWLENAFNKDRSFIDRTIKNFYPGTNVHLHNNYGIVKVYEAATTLINQHPLENGKTMGLSAYGCYNEKNTLINKDGMIYSDYFSSINNENFKEASCFANFETEITNNLTQENYQLYADKAKQVQIETQDAALKLIKEYTELTNIKNVCVVGGYGLNVVANAYYIQNLPDINFYFEPVADDAGISVGAAMLKYRQLTKNKDIVTPKDNFYHYYAPDKIDLKKYHTEIADTDTLVNLLNSGYSVAIFEGNPEAGPRALGHRSILFDAGNCNAKDTVNKIKKREWYRPFAAVILQDYLKDYFEKSLDKSEYMTVNYKVLEDKKHTIPGVIHKDSTCRLQTVNSGFLYELLNSFYNLTECPLLLNTSFNLAGEPLVQTKADAVMTLEKSSLDYVYFVEEKILVRKKDESV